MGEPDQTPAAAPSGAAYAVDELLARAAAERPEGRAMVEEDGRSLTWAEVEDLVARTAAGLARTGVVAGYRVALVQENSVDLVVAYLAVLRARAVAVPLNPRAGAADLRAAVAGTGARVVLCDAASVVVVREAVDGLAEPAPRVVAAGAEQRAGEQSLDELRNLVGRALPGRADPESLAVLLLTSGASGRPRAAMLTHRALLANLAQVGAVEPPLVRGDDVVLGVLPLFHVYGLNAVLGPVLRTAGTLVLQRRFDPEGTLALVERAGCTVLPVAPPVLAAWLALEPDRVRAALAGVRLVVSGSAPLPAETVEQFRAVTGHVVAQGYGLTEAAPVVTSTLVGDVPASAGSVGAALPGVELRLVDDAGAPAAPGDPGEIEVRGDHLFSGYWPDGADGPGADGWWRTGDVGLLDDDGHLTLVDRVRDVVVVSGFHVYPAEVEEVLAAVPGVVSAAVVGVPDPATGEAVVAYLRTDLPVEERAALAETARARCEERLARFKVPARLEVVDELPRTATGKVAKGRLRGMARRRADGLV
ncbi:class I adenylate-forming enzyme family protein [Nocardioides perillae]|uniref:Long-chain acyl-CoA synthetase n=1 Tax=Nocardioides perillae TaxID=1119534 RepID=A0A7Y9UKV6_9ACTN|nr:AMP-binding protein [Nocardioides perillae]NYG53786.1 long-chain acyl-CoA synthetase [Nocardioides perillae]